MKVSIIGSGAYGVALSSILHRNKVEVCMWAHSVEEKESLEKTRVSSKLKDYKIPEDIKITNSLEEAIKGSCLVVIAVPAFAFEETIKKLKEYIDKETPILIATKGIQQDTCLFLHDVFK